MILSYDTYLETLEEKENKQSEVKTLAEKYDKDMKAINDRMAKLDETLNKVQRLEKELGIT